MTVTAVCRDCGRQATRFLKRNDCMPEQANGTHPGGYDPLCADCEYLRINPDAPLAVRSARGAKPQEERLFDA